MFWRSGSVHTAEVENGDRVKSEAGRPGRRVRVILTLALSAALGGFLVSYAFAPKYTSTATILIEPQQVSSDYVKPVISSNLTQHLQTLTQLALSTSRLRPLVDELNPAKPATQEKLMDQIRVNLEIEPISMVDVATPGVGSDKKGPSATNQSVAGFYVIYSDSDPQRAQKLCNTMASLILDENLKSRADAATSATEFFQRQVDDAKRALVEMDTQLLGLSKDRSSRSPEAEAKYKMLALDYDIAQKKYTDLLATLTQIKLGNAMEFQSMGEQMTLVQSAVQPEIPDLPNRPLFAVVGFGAGLMLGVGRILWPTRKAATESQPVNP